MTNFILQAGGTLQGNFPWSVNAMATSANSEAAVNTAWLAMWNAIFANTGFKVFIPTNTELTFVSTSTADATFHQTTKTSATASAVGTSTGTATGYRDCLIISLETAQATRWGRGRWYFPGLASNAIDSTGFHYSAAATTAASAALTAAVTTFTSTAALQIARRKATAHGPGAFTLTPVTAGKVSDEVATQRRRADKRVVIYTGFTI